MKKTLSSLRALTHHLELEHPQAGPTGAWIKMKSPRNNQYFYRANELADQPDDAPIQQKVSASAELAALLIEDWDEDFFEGEFSIKRARELLEDVENFWIRDAINNAAAEPERFFKKA